MVLVFHVIYHDHVLKRSYNFLGRSPSRQVKPSCKVWWLTPFWLWSYEFSLSRDLAGPCDQKVMWLARKEPLMVSHHTATFGDHRHCSSGDMFLVVEGQDSTYPPLIPPLLFISKAHDMPSSNTPNFKM